METVPAPGPVFDSVRAAAYLGVARGTVRAALVSGRLPARRLGRRWLVSKAALDAWLAGDGQPVAPTVARRP